MVLYYSKASPFARKVLIVAHELGIAAQIKVESVEVSPVKVNADYTKKNPLSKVPALLLEDGSTIFDSTVICEYLESITAPGKLIPVSPQARAKAMTTHALLQGMTDSTILLRYESALRPENLRWKEWSEGQWRKVWAGLETLELDASLDVNKIDLVSAALGSFLGYLDFRFPESGWRAKAPRISKWWDLVKSTPSFAVTDPNA